MSFRDPRPTQLGVGPDVASGRKQPLSEGIVDEAQPQFRRGDQVRAGLPDQYAERPAGRAGRAGTDVPGQEAEDPNVVDECITAL